MAGLEDLWQGVSGDLRIIQISDNAWRQVSLHLWFETIRWFSKAAKTIAEYRAGVPVEGRDICVVLRIIDFPLDPDNPESQPYNERGGIIQALTFEPRVINYEYEFKDDVYEILRSLGGRTLDIVLVEANREAEREGQTNPSTRRIDTRHTLRICDKLPYPLNLWLC